MSNRCRRSADKGQGLGDTCFWWSPPTIIISDIHPKVAYHGICTYITKCVETCKVEQRSVPLNSRQSLNPLIPHSFDPSMLHTVSSLLRCRVPSLMCLNGLSSPTGACVAASKQNLCRHWRGCYKRAPGMRATLITYWWRQQVGTGEPDTSNMHNCSSPEFAQY